MRNLVSLPIILLCVSCGLLPFEIQKTPLKPDQAVVFDIDGTLTPSPSAIFTARDDAANAVRLYADEGYKIIYLSARIKLFQTGIPNEAVEKVVLPIIIFFNLLILKGWKMIKNVISDLFYSLNWLKENRFPEGSIHVPETAEDGSDPVAFKKRILEGYKTNGWTFVAAYGDSSRDFEAYAKIGIDKDHVFALQRAGEAKCQEGAWKRCLRSWTEDMDAIRAALAAK